MKSDTPAGSWKSKINTDLVAGKVPRISCPHLNGERFFWQETRPQEHGRQTIMLSKNGVIQSLLPAPWSSKARVHEYGGCSYCVYQDDLFFVLADTQQVNRIKIGQKKFSPEALTDHKELRFADLTYDTQHQQIIAVCEHHSHKDKTEPTNYLVSIPANAQGQLKVLTSGHDFYSNPTVSPCGSRLMWLTWNHPHMPWDATELWIADIQAQGELSNIRQIAGHNGKESLFQPQWSPSGDIFFVSDRSDWWNLYKITQHDLRKEPPHSSPVTQLEAEFATPQWVFGMSTFGFIDENRILATFTQNGTWVLTEIALNGDAKIKPIATPFTLIDGIHCEKGQGVFLGTTPLEETNVAAYKNKAFTLLKSPDNLIDQSELSTAIPISFKSSNNALAHAFFYQPTNHQHFSSRKPPLMVICHGGPTGATSNALNYKIQFWTNRGFAVLDVNYRGSTGYGRQFRRSLYGQWGVYDVDDVCAATQYVIDQGWAAADKKIIKGSSAGGYTVLAALTFRRLFDAGVSLYGIGDLRLLAEDTHKFESHYMESLIGPLDAHKDRYHERSPIHFPQQLNCPLLIFQGLEDKVVPPNQAETMVEAVKKKGLPVAYVTYKNEGHGFQQKETIEHMLNTELYFYNRIFDLGIDTGNHAVTIHNL